MRLADYLMQRLVEAGAAHIFQVTGRGSLFLSDALAKNGDLRAVSLHHEQACAFAAVGYAQQTGVLGVCLVSTGCASTNALTGVLSAWQDGIACFFISGQNILRETSRFTDIPLRTYGQQETDIVSLVSPVTKFAHMITDPRDIGRVIDEALFAAHSGRKGPVWLDIPLDLQSAIVDPEQLSRRPMTPSHPDTEYESTNATIDAVAELLVEAKRPVVLIGSGIKSAGAEQVLREFIGRWQIPLTYTSSAPDSYGSHEPLSIGSVGAMGCSRAGNFAVQNADLVLVLGSRLSSLSTGPDFCKFARSAKTVVVDIDPVEHSKDSIRIDHFINCDLRYFLDRLCSYPELVSADRQWLAKCQHWKSLFGSIEPAFIGDDRVDLYQLAEALSGTLPTPSTLVTDSGLVEVILPTNIRFQDGVRCIHPVSQGSMGFALPAAIGAQFGAGDQLVVAVIGDGSIMMNLQELESVRYHQLPIKIVVINNNVYSIIRRRQRELFRKRTIGTDPDNGVSCPDFSQLARCFGIEYMRISHPSELKDGLSRMMEYDGSVMCEVMSRTDQGYIELGQTRAADGRFVRRPLEDQQPFLPRDLFLREMLIETIDQ